MRIQSAPWYSFNTNICCRKFTADGRKIATFLSTLLFDPLTHNAAQWRRQLLRVQKPRASDQLPGYTLQSKLINSSDTRPRNLYKWTQKLTRLTCFLAQVYDVFFIAQPQNHTTLAA